MTIRLLDESTINQIAAGEVVERPASVVKELVENSLDAGATRILVDIAADLLTVRDNGGGMSPTEMRLAVQRHATSKIETASDLSRIRTYGFRGEALPSIAAVSQLAIRSRPPGQDAGSLLCLEAGEVVADEPVSMPEGTQIEVRRLFFNTPVRAKFLRSERTELARAVQAVERLALARHDVSFVVTAAGREVLRTPGTGQASDTLIAVYGVETARDTALGRAVLPGGGVLALVGGAATARSDRRRQGVFVNGRPVWARGLLEVGGAVLPQGMLPGRPHPLLLLYLELPPDEVDANVHPTKAEVRLGGENAIFAAVVHAIRNSAGAGRPGADETAEVFGRSEAAAKRIPDGLPTAQPGRQWPPRVDGVRPEYQATTPRPAELQEEPGLWQLATGALAHLRPIGQAANRWLVCDGPGGVYLLDQHAAHERVLYEKLSTALPVNTPGASSTAQGEASQGLAVPATVELGPTELVIWSQFRDELDALGLVTEEFGGSTVIVRAVPHVLAGAAGHGLSDPGQMLHDLLAELGGEGQETALAPRLRARRALASCTAAVKAAAPLAMPQLESLLRDLAACADPLRCPHGRPTVVLLSNAELARRFGRS